MHDPRLPDSTREILSDHCHGSPFSNNAKVVIRSFIVPISRRNIPGRVLEVVDGIAVSFVLVGIASSYLLAKILIIVLPGFRDSVY